MKHLKALMRPYKKEAILGPLFKLLEAGFDLCVPLAVAAIIDHGIKAQDVRRIWLFAGVLVILAAVGLAAAVTAQYFAARAAVGVATELRQSLFDKVQSLSFSQTDKLGTSTLITRMTGDVNQVQTGVNLFLRLFLRSPLIVFGAAIMAFAVDRKISLIFFGVILLLAAVVFGIMLAGIPLHKRVQGKLDAVTGRVRRNLTGVRVLRAFGQEEEEREAFSEENGALVSMQRFVGRVSALLNPATYVLINAGIILLIYTGAIQMESGDLTQGEMVALYNYMTQILVELVKLASLIITLTRSAACMRRVGDVLDIAPDGELYAGVIPEKGEGNHVEFRDVSFRYGGAGADSLSHITLHAERGETVGVIGGTGSGKSTLVNLIPRFYDATEGEVLVDGVSVSKQDRSALRGRVGIVMQRAELFAGTVRDNLLFGNGNATDEELRQALAAAQAEETFREKGGLDAPVSQKGANLSGGQKQRLTVARALVRRPDILILDDASSALDFATDAALRRAIRELPYHPTVFMVSQRASGLRHADRILVLDDGCAVGLGTHDELMETCDVYREIYFSQYDDSEEGGRA